MMSKLLAICVLLTIFLPDAGRAAARELSQAELRNSAKSGATIRLAKVIKGVERTFGGTPVDARAFQVDGVYYRILIKKPDGKIISVIVDAETGMVVANKSGIGRQITEAARTASGNSAKTKSRGQSAAKGNNGNRGGNSGGNSGGNGGGNSGGGGNGGGNSGGGGNGGGNSGGNGGGKN